MRPLSPIVINHLKEKLSIKMNILSFLIQQHMYFLYYDG